MVKDSLKNYFKFYIFPIGRILFVLQEILKLVPKVKDASFLKPIIEKYIKEAQKVLKEVQKEQARKGKKTVKKKKNVLIQFNADADKALAAFARSLTAWETLYPEDVNTLKQSVIPNGIGSLIHLPYAEQVEQVDNVIKLLDGKLKKQVKKLHMEKFVEKIKETNEAFKKGLEEYQRQKESGSSEKTNHLNIKEATKEAHEKLLQVIVLILGHYYSQSEDHIYARQTLLKPILDQNEAIRKHRLGKKRRVPDVDPETGEEILPQEQSSGNLDS